MRREQTHLRTILEMVYRDGSERPQPTDSLNFDSQVPESTAGRRDQIYLFESAFRSRNLKLEIRRLKGIPKLGHSHHVHFSENLFKSRASRRTVG